MPNPYLSQQADAIQNNATNNLQRRILPGINSGAIAAGGFGGSRQGIAQGLAIGETNRGVSDAQANLFSQGYNTDTQAQLARDQMASQQAIAGMQNQTTRDLGFGNLGLGYTQAGNQYSLGLGQLGLGNKQADQNYSLGIGNLGLGQYNAETNRGLGYGQLAQQGDQNAFNNQLAGYNAQLNGLNALQGWNSQGVNLANQQQQIPLQNLTTLGNLGMGIGGQGSSSSQPGASTLQNALAGGLTLAQLYKIISGG